MRYLRDLRLRYYLPNAGQMYSSMITLGDNILVALEAMQFRVSLGLKKSVGDE